MNHHDQNSLRRRRFQRDESIVMGHWPEAEKSCLLSQAQSRGSAGKQSEAVHSQSPPPARPFLLYTQCHLLGPSVQMHEPLEGITYSNYHSGMASWSKDHVPFLLHAMHLFLPFLSVNAAFPPSRSRAESASRNKSSGYLYLASGISICVAIAPTPTLELTLAFLHTRTPSLSLRFNYSYPDSQEDNNY